MRPLHDLRSLFVLLALAAACKEVAPPPEAPRPVTVFNLETIDPIRPLQISGSVKSWNEQDIAFEVEGPVDFIVRETTHLEGRWVEAGKVTSEGELLARLRDREFAIERDAARANLAAAQEDLNLAKTQLAKLLPSQVRAAEANQVRAEAEYERFVEARKTNAVAELDVIRHKADMDQREAETEEARARLESKAVEIRSLEARVEQANEALVQAQYDLDRCTLFAPFSGEVSEVFIKAGGYARVAEAVAHLVMMDPIKVDVAVSAARAAQLRVGEAVTLYPLAGGEVRGAVYEKATEADPQTRTFRVSVIVRNARASAELPADSPLRELPRVEMFERLQVLDAGDENSPFVVDERNVLRRDDQGYYVWATDELASGRTLERANPVLNFRRVRVVPGEERRNFQGLYVARALADPGKLDASWVVARRAPEGYEGGKTLVMTRDWQLRPGQIVPTLLGVEPPEAGLYMPMKAIAGDVKDDKGAVFVEDAGTARRVPVRKTAVVAEMVRVEALDEAGAALLVNGARIILDSVHFLRDGETVRVVRTRELAP